jgi:crossover junction endodeoxyribonuclease RuvC
MIILGIDPGTRFTGFGVVSVVSGVERMIDCGLIRPADGADHTIRLDHIYREVLRVVDAVNPDECAVEMPVYGNNAQSMLKLGRAQAAAMLAALHREVPVTQYTPAEVKKSVTGNGRASKEQISYMVCSLLDLATAGRHDVSDALAVALCHAHRMNSRSSARHKDWKSFVAANPGRVRSG